MLQASKPFKGFADIRGLTKGENKITWSTKRMKIQAKYLR